MFSDMSRLRHHYPLEDLRKTQVMNSKKIMTVWGSFVWLVDAFTVVSLESPFLSLSFPLPLCRIHIMAHFVLENSLKLVQVNKSW